MCLSEAPNPISTLPLHTVFVYTVCLFTQGRGIGGESWAREKVREATVHKAGSKIPTWLTESPVCKTNTFRKVPLQISSVRWRHFPSVSMWLISPWCASKGRVEWWKLRSWIAGLETKRIEEDYRRCRRCTSHMMCTQRNLAPLLPQCLTLSSFHHLIHASQIMIICGFFPRYSE